MLQRAASNAYSWWWASHIRTKQSKWLEQHLQDMEEKVGLMLKLIEEDGDSFAKRAEMYYKKRPELISFVEESFRAYRALAERYDHISKELQNANNTIASVFPEQVQFAMDEDDEYASPRIPKNPTGIPKLNIPKVPKLPNRDLRGLLTTAVKKLRTTKTSKSGGRLDSTPRFGLTKTEAVKEVDKLQKEILALQTEKEFVKSSYEHGVAKFWEIEQQIKDMQQSVFDLQDKFNIGAVIEDDEARKLMAAAALKSCQKTLSQLQENQEKSTEEAKVEYQRIREAWHRLETLKHEPSQERPHDKDGRVKKEEENKNFDQDGSITTQDRQGSEGMLKKIKEQPEISSSTPLTVIEMAEKVDELVNKVINLETAVTSQNALVKRLRMECDELRSHIQRLENENASLADGKMEEKLHGIELLNQNIEDQNTSLQAHFTEAQFNLDHLSEKLLNLKEAQEDEVIEVRVPLPKEDGPLCLVESQKEEEKEKSSPHDLEKYDSSKPVEKLEDKGEGSSVKKADSAEIGVDCLSVEQGEQQAEDEDSPNWKKLFMHGMENREKTLLDEYTQALRNCKDIKKKLSDVEKKNQDNLSETTDRLRESRSLIAKKDDEIRSLRQKLSLLHPCLNKNKDYQDHRLSSEELIANEKEIEQDEYEDDDDLKAMLKDQPRTISAIEEKFRMNIDELLEQNLEFWLRFSTSFHQIQKFQTGVEDLQGEVRKLEKKAKKKSNASNDTTDSSLKSDARPIYKHLREIQTELTIWLEQNALLKDELQNRFSALCNIQEEISGALKIASEGDEKFTSYQAAKFKGEVLNMKQENNKVADELQAGLDHVTNLQLEIERTLAKLDEDFQISESKSDSQLTKSPSRARVPLQSFIFGVKAKRDKPSIFSCVHPVLHRKYNHLRTAMPM